MKTVTKIVLTALLAALVFVLQELLTESKMTREKLNHIARP